MQFHGHGASVSRAYLAPILPDEQRHMCVNNCQESLREAERTGLKPVTYWLQVRRPNHYATRPHRGDFDGERVGTAFPLLNLKYGRTHSVKAEFSSVTRLPTVNKNSFIVHLVS